MLLGALGFSQVSAAYSEGLIVEEEWPDPELIFSQDNSDPVSEELTQADVRELEEYFAYNDTDWSDELIEDLQDEDGGISDTDSGLADTDILDASDDILDDAELFSEDEAQPATEEDPLIAEADETEEPGSEETDALPDPSAAAVETAYEYGRFDEKLFAASGGSACSWVFGTQLSGGALSLYQSRVSYYAQNWKTGTLDLTFKVTNSPVTFDATDHMVSFYDDTGKLKYRVDTTSDVYAQAKSDFEYVMQASVDALLYDHPEVFWYRAGTFKYGVSASYSNGKWTGFISSMKNTPGIIYSGADSAETISAYRAAVGSVCSGIRAAADYNQDGAVTDAELLQSIHDYLCERLYYDREGLSTYTQTHDYRIFSSIGAFLDSAGTGVVCEGYAKAFKVLCDNLGFDCILIGGKTASGEGHMWNAVQIDGTWYLVDVTWDDQRSGPPAYTYYLTCNQSGRTSSGNFGGTSDRPHIFVYPVLTSHAHSFAIQDVSIPDVSAADGEILPLREYRICAEDGISYYTDHAYITAITPPTCTLPGYTSYTCSEDGFSKNGSSVPALGHSYENGICVRCGLGDDLANAVIEAGTMLYTGKPVIPAVKVSFGDTLLLQDVDYTVTVENNTNIGTASLTVCAANGSIWHGQQTVSFQIQPRPVGTASVTPIADKTYDGNTKTPPIILHYNGQVLRNGIDYTVTYSKNRAVGTASAVVNGIGNYTGQRTVTFQILPPRVTGTSLTAGENAGRAVLTWKGLQGLSLNGYQIQYAATSAFSGAKSLTVSAGKTQAALSALPSGKPIYVRIRAWVTVSGVRYYSEWSIIRKAMIK